MTIEFQPPKRNVKHFVNGAINFMHSEMLPVTQESNARLAHCLKCEFYSENSRSADTGKKSCRLCGCPVERKVKIPDQQCELPAPLKKW